MLIGDGARHVRRAQVLDQWQLVVLFSQLTLFGELCEMSETKMVPAPVGGSAAKKSQKLARRFRRMSEQFRGISPFQGDIKPTRVPLFAFGSGRPTMPFPHPWNYKRPLDLLRTFFWGAEAEEGSGRDNRYLEVPWFAPVYVSRDYGVIKVITHETGDKPGEFDRDTLPTDGIARATGEDTLLYSNGPFWREQKRLAAAPFGKTTLFQPEQFHEFATTFKQTAFERLQVLRGHLHGKSGSVRLQFEPEIKAVMLEMLSNNFFGTNIAYDEIRNHYVPAIERVIDNIVRDTVMNRIGIPLKSMPPITARIRQNKEDHRSFDKLTDLVLAQRPLGTGLWRQFKSDVASSKLRSNIKVFQAGALEATTSFACWAISHLARDPVAQERVYQEVKDITDYTPEALDQCTYLLKVLDETLRLTPALYFLPRRPTVDTWITTDDGRKLFLPEGTHILLDVWDCNRNENHWGVARTGFPARLFAPDRWDNIPKTRAKDFMHFGFGNGPRVCPGKHLGMLETALVVGAIVKLFRFKAVNPGLEARAGVSTKPADGVFIDLELR